MVSHTRYQIRLDEFSEDPTMEFRLMEISEVMGGELPQGVITMLTSSKSQSSKYLGKTLEMTIQTPSYRGNFKVFITNVQQNSTTALFTFLITDPYFINEIQSRLLANDMNTAISRLYPGKVTKKVESSINQMELRQTRETDYNCLKRLMLGYGKDVLYGFSMDGMVITTFSAQPASYPHYKPFTIDLGVNDLSENKIKYEQFDPPRTSKKAFRYFRVVAYDKSISYTAKDGSPFEENISANYKSRMEPKLSMKRTYENIPPYKLGDKINLADPESNPTNATEFFVTSRGFTFDSSGVFTTMALSKYD